MGVAPQQTSINDKKSPPLKNHTLMPQNGLQVFKIRYMCIIMYVCLWAMDFLIYTILLKVNF